MVTRNSSALTLTLPPDREILMTRDFDAPPPRLPGMHRSQRHTALVGAQNLPHHRGQDGHEAGRAVARPERSP